VSFIITRRISVSDKHTRKTFEFVENHPMLLEHETGKRFGEEHALLGLELAFAANDARDRSRALESERHARISAGYGHADFYENVLMPENDAKSEATVYHMLYLESVNAAAALIGRFTLGGEVLCVQNGHDYITYDDGSSSGGWE
jgi:hypothetical protein